MIQRSRFRLFCLATAALVAVLPFVPISPAAEPDPEKLERFYEGTEVLRRIFYDQKFKPIGSFEDLENEVPRDVILFFLGSSGLDRVELEDFVRRGGALMIATSHPIRSEAAMHEIDRVTGWHVAGITLDYRRDLNALAEADRQRIFYEGKSHCPFVVLRPGAAGPFERLFLKPGTDSSLERIATNEPSYLRPTFRRDRAAQFAELPQTWFANQGRMFPYSPPFAVGGKLSEGRFLLLASHRMFINRMMLPTDTDNVEFAQNCLTALADGKRKKLLFVEYGTVNPKFEVPLKAPEIPDNLGEMILGGLLKMGEQLPQFQEKLARAESDDRFHRGLWSFLAERGVRGSDVLRWVLLILSGLFAVYGFIRLVGPGRYRLDSATPLLPRVVAKQLPQGALVERRRQAMLDNNNLWEAARARARSELTEAGVPTPLPGARAPTVHVNGNWWRRWRLRRRALRLWRLAFAATPQLVPKAAWELIQRELAELKAALASGAVQFK